MLLRIILLHSVDWIQLLGIYAGLSRFRKRYIKRLYERLYTNTKIIT